MSDKPKYCPNCGGFLDDSGWCKYCGSKIFEGTEPKEEKTHECLYDEVALTEDVINCCATLIFRCESCGNLLKVPVSEMLIRNLRGT